MSKSIFVSRTPCQIQHKLGFLGIFRIFSEFYHKIHKNSLINCQYEHFYLTLLIVWPPILPIFPLLGPPLPLPPAALACCSPDRRRLVGGGAGIPQIPPPPPRPDMPPSWNWPPLMIVTEAQQNNLFPSGVLEWAFPEISWRSLWNYVKESMGNLKLHTRWGLARNWCSEWIAEKSLKRSRSKDQNTLNWKYKTRVCKARCKLPV